MTTNITFSYQSYGIFDRIDAETSRHASFLRFQDGSSAYDALKIHTNDRQTIEDFIDDAFRSISSRFDGDSVFSKENGSLELKFYLPDFDEDRSSEAKEEIRRFVILSTTARWLRFRTFGDYANVVSADAESSFNRIVAVLRTRKNPLD